MKNLNDLFTIRECDIYNNPNVSEEEIRKIAKIISADKGIDLEEYFDLLKCSSKFCWLNYLKILDMLPEDDKIRGLPVLFELLQDANWPTFQKTVEILEKFDKKVLEPHFHKYLEQAYAEDDGMWADNMKLLAEKLGLKGNPSLKPPLFDSILKK